MTGNDMNSGGGPLSGGDGGGFFAFGRMRNASYTRAAVGLLGCCLTVTALAEDASLQVTANRDRIYLGESVQLTVQVGNAGGAEPDLTEIRNCGVRLLGSQSESRVSIINGRMERFSGRTYAYELTPSAAGSFVAGPVTLSVPGRVLAEPGPMIEVAGIEAQTCVVISVRASKEAVLVDESFDVTLSILMERMKGRFADVDPIDPNEPPVLNIPFLEAQPMQGLEGPNIQQLLQQHLLPRPDLPGFAVNKYTIRNDPFGGMFGFSINGIARELPAKFGFERKAVEKDGTSFFEYTLKLKYTAKEEGSRTFGPVVFKGKAVIGADAGGNAFGRMVFAVGPACTVRVVPPPDQGRPPSFIGTIGTNLAARASLDAQTCNVGDPLTLTIAISGDVTMESIYPLILSEQAQLTRDFKVYDDSVRTSKKDGAREFSYTIRPIRAGTLELPPVEVSYFDAAARAYRTVRTQPIPVRANVSADVAASMIIDTVTNRGATAVDIATTASLVIAPVDMDPAGTESVDLWRPGLNAILAGSGPLACVLALVIRRLRWLAAQRARTAGTRGARRKTVSIMAEAERIAPVDPGRASRLVVEALKGYVSGRCGIAEGALTPEDAHRVLRAMGAPDEPLRRFREVLERNFNAVYSGSNLPGLDAARDCRTAREAVDEIEQALGVPRAAEDNSTLRVPGRILMIILFACAAPALKAGQGTEEFIWNEANSRMASARTAPEFLGAARAYERLVAGDVRNGPLFYNLGTALLKAGESRAAVEALLRAERYDGSNPEIQRNIRLAMRRGPKDRSEPLPWYRVPLFWHYGLSAQTRLSVAAVAFSLCWLAYLLRVVAWGKRFAGPLTAFALAALILFGSSAVTSLREEVQAADAVATGLRAAD